mgnify:CR=1 FL=1
MANSVITLDNVSFRYPDAGRDALSGVSLSIEAGSFIAVLGHNGSGKSTLAKLLNAILVPTEGTVTVKGMDTRSEENLLNVRRTVGMVFQNPDNQFVSTIVGEDVAFGLENYGVPENEIPARVAAALAAVDMAGYENRATHTLSGGQKQRVALAGVLALSPDILVFDEATAMLDPDGRQEVLRTIRRLHKEQRKTVVMITHYIEEAIGADRVYLIHNGKMIADGTAREMLTQPELLAAAGLTPPMPVQMYYDLKQAGIVLARCPLTLEELAEELCRSQ